MAGNFFVRQTMIDANKGRLDCKTICFYVGFLTQKPWWAFEKMSVGTWLSSAGLVV
jgi:hypothetical protein